MAARSAEELMRSHSSHSPRASRASTWLAVRTCTDDAVAAHRGRPTGSQACGGALATEDGEDVGEVDIGPFEADQIAGPLGQRQRLLDDRDALIRVAAVHQVDPEHGQCPHLRLLCTHRPRLGERLASHRQRLGESPRHHEPTREGRQCVGPLARPGVLAGHGHRALEASSAALSSAVSYRYSPRRTCRRATRCQDSPG